MLFLQSGSPLHDPDEPAAKGPRLDLDSGFAAARRSSPPFPRAGFGSMPTGYPAGVGPGVVPMNPNNPAFRPWSNREDGDVTAAAAAAAAATAAAAETARRGHYYQSKFSKTLD